MTTLIRPSEEWQAAFADMAAEFAAHGNPRYVADADDFSAFLKRVRAESAGQWVREDGSRPVRMSTFWLVDADRILGTSRLRHALTPALLHEGGNIGYDVRPLARRQGHATRLLSLTLEQAVAIGLQRVRITCDVDNVGSIRVIERNGGVLEGEAASNERSSMIRQYWIELTRSPGV